MQTHNQFNHIEVQLNRAHGCRDTVLASKTSGDVRWDRTKRNESEALIT